MIYNNVLELIGNTKIIKLNRLSEKYCNNIYAKIEFSNPFGSIKDRIVLNIINEALKDNKINYDTTVIVPTSGNTGIAVAAICLFYKIKCIIVMPENMSKERKSIIKAYKAKLILTSSSLGMKGSVSTANDLLSKISNSFILSQFEDNLNPLTHYDITAKEISNDINLDYFFSGIGTGGTISGCGQFLKEQNNSIKVIGVEPIESSVISNGIVGKHDIQGIGAGFVPNTLNLKYIDQIITVSSSEAYNYMDELKYEEVVYAGISSGASLAGIVKFIKENNIINKKILFICSDSYFNYLSVGERCE